MKLFFVLLTLSLTVFAAPAVPDTETEKHIEIVKVMLAECKAAEGGSDSDHDGLLNGDFPDTPKAHCMVTCMNEKVGVYKDGKYSKEGFIEMARVVTKNDSKMMPVALELADECGLVVKDVTERCDFGVKFETCLHDGLKTRKIDIDLF